MLLLSGLLDLGFAAFHLAFWRLFGWPERLEASGRLNMAVTQTLNVMLTFVFAAYGGALVVGALRGWAIPPLVPLSGAGFWLVRLGLQFRWFPMRNSPSLLFTLVVSAALLAHGLAALLAT